jgi:hypothetical protein
MLIVAVASGVVFLCADRPSEPLLSADHDKCTAFELKTLKAASAPAGARVVNVRVDQGYDGLNKRYRLFDISVRVDCPSRRGFILQSTTFAPDGSVKLREKSPKPVPMPAITDPMQQKAFDAVCRAKLP